MKTEVEENAPKLDALKTIANQILDFLERDVERLEVQSQMENLLSLTVIILETLSKNLAQVGQLVK